MSEVLVGNFNRVGAIRPDMFGTQRVRDALADELKQRYPAGTRKAVERAFKLSVDEARSACNGSAGPGTLDRIWRRGGWDLVIPVFTRLLGEDVAQHFGREAQRHAQIADRSRSFADLSARHSAAQGDEPGWGLGGRRRRVGERSASTTDGGGQ